MALQLAILASGSGSNAQAMFEAVEHGLLDADIRLVFCNRPDAKVLDRAKAFNIPNYCLDHKKFAHREDYDKEMCRIIKEHGADTVAMAGYMRLVTAHFLEEFAGRVLNVHPALLPAFPGVHGAKDAVDYGVKFSGCSVHFVSEEMDAGPIVIQAIVPCWQCDSEADLQGKIHALEHKIYVQALQWLAQERLTIVGHTVHLLPTGAVSTEEGNKIKKKAPKATFLGIDENEKYPLGAMIYPPLDLKF